MKVPLLGAVSSRLRNRVEAISASYWFVPTVMVVLALVLGGVFVWLDSGPAAGALDGLSWYQLVKPEGAHEVLSTIAGSMITVAGVTFSITIVAIAFAANQYGPRLLTNFMSDRGNQITLGTFIATFVYCLAVLRTIRGGDGDATFVPQVAVLVGLLLALCSIAVLIYFIHHVPESIHINNVAHVIGRRLIEMVPKRFPKSIGDPADPPAPVPRLEPGRVILSHHTGYIQAIDEGMLLDAARRHDLVVTLRYRPGDFIHHGRPLLEVSPAERAADAEDALRSAMVVGAKRTPAGDLDFLVGELVEIAARALSPGINDPATATTCIDWLGAGASSLAQRQTPSTLRTDEEGVVRLIACAEDFDRFIERSFGRLRQHLSTSVEASGHMLRVLETVAADCTRLEHKQACAKEAERLIQAARAKLSEPDFAALPPTDVDRLAPRVLTAGER